jgi:hypothetical protein
VVDSGDMQIDSVALDAEAFDGGGRLEGAEEVIEIRSGVAQLRVATAPEEGQS